MNRPEAMLPPLADPVPEWNQSLSTGAPGTALLHVEAAHRGDVDWATVHAWVSAMTRTAVISDSAACGLFHGAPAVAYVLHAAGRRSYARALATLDTHIDALTHIRLERAHRRIDHGQLPALREYDLISGLTGLGAYAFHRHGTSELLRDVLTYLVRLITEPLAVDGLLVPGWWSGDGPGGTPSADWPGGHGNIGVAHGIAGPLALLAITARHRVTVPGHFKAIEEVTALLDRFRTGSGTSAWWPETVSAAEWTSGTVHQRGPGRPSWCYGTPGLARAQQLAALASGDAHRQRDAEDALLGCVTDEAQLGRLRDASLCHGWAGVLHTVRRAAADAATGRLDDEIPALRPRLADCLSRHGTPAPDGLLEGPAGAELAGLCTDSAWDMCLLTHG